MLLHDGRTEHPRSSITKNNNYYIYNEESTWSYENNHISETTDGTKSCFLCPCLSTGVKHEKENQLGGKQGEDQVWGGNFFLRGPGPETFVGSPPNTSGGQLLPARGLLYTVLVSFPLNHQSSLSCFHKSIVSGIEMRCLAFKRREMPQEAELGKKLVGSRFFWLRFSQMCHNLNVKMIKDFRKQKGLEDKEETSWVDKGSCFKLIEASRTCLYTTCLKSWGMDGCIWGPETLGSIFASASLTDQVTLCPSILIYSNIITAPIS